MSTWTPFLAIVLLALTPGSRAVLPQAPDAQDELERRVQTLVEMECEEHEIPGLALTIGVGSEVFLAHGWGVADAGSGEVADVESLFRAGSLTVQLAAVAALQLLEANELSLDDRVVDLLAQRPDLDRGVEGEVSKEETPAPGALAGVTLHHLLSQTSGLPDYAEHFADTDVDRADVDLAHVLRWLAGEAPEADPGTCFAYSTTNTFLVGSIVEHVAGITFAEYCERNLFAPLELENTRYSTGAPAIRELADAEQEVRGAVEDDGPCPHPFQAEALCTSSNDLFLWTRALVEGALLDASSTASLLEAKRLPSGRATGFGYGVSHTTLEDQACLSFGGGMAGARLHAAYYPVLDLTICVLAASEDAAIDHLERKLARLFLRLPDPEIQDLALTAEERSRYVGGYYEGCTRLEILTAGERLAFLTPYEDAEQLVLLHQGDHRFVAREDPDLRLTFEVEEGRVVALVIDDHGIERRAMRLE